MARERKRKYQWHDGFFRFVINRDRDCVADLIKILMHCGVSEELQELFTRGVPPLVLSPFCSRTFGLGW